MSQNLCEHASESASMQKSSRLGLLQIHISVILAGGAGLFGKLVTVSPKMITCGRTFFGSLALGLVSLCMGSSLRTRSAKDLCLLAGSGFVLAIHWYSFFASIHISTIAIGLLSFSTFPLFVTFLEPLVFKEKLKTLDIWIALLVVLGLLFVIPEWDISNHLTQGALWGILSAFSYSVLSIWTRSLVKSYTAMSVAFYQQGFATLCVLPFAVKSEALPAGQNLVYLAILGIVFTGLAHGLAVASLRHLRAQMVGVAFGMEPVYGIIFAWLILGEKPQMQTLLGGMLILSAVILASFKAR